MSMDDLGMDPRIVGAIREAGIEGIEPHVEVLVDALVLGGESVSVGAALGDGRLPVMMAAAAEWLARAGEEGRALFVVADERDVAPARDAFDRIGGAAGLSSVAAGREASGSIAGAQAAFGSLATLSARHDEGTMDLAAYGLVVIVDMDGLVEQAKVLKTLRGKLMTQWKRRTLVFSERFGTVERKLALDISDPPREIRLEDDAGLARSLQTSSWYVDGPDKPRVLLGLLEREARRPVAVLCNLPDTASAAASILQGRGVRAALASGAAAEVAAAVSAAAAGDRDVVVMTDASAVDAPVGWAGLLVNWDIPLEGEPYAARLRLVDRSGEGLRVANFVCDRYVYGLDAIGRRMGAPLKPERPDEGLLRREAGRPAARVSERPSGRTSGHPAARDGRPPERAGTGSGSAGGPRRQGGDRGRGPGRREQEYDGRNVHAIRADIAALTGGLAAPEPVPAVARGENPAGRVKPDRSADRQPDRRPERTGKPSGRQGKRDGRGTRPASVGTVAEPAIADPYSVSMEERMRLYREKYGGAVNGAGSGPVAGGGNGKRKKHRGYGRGRGGHGGDAVSPPDGPAGGT